MPRMIDADALLMDNTWAFYDRFGNRTSAGLAIEEAPTVDAVEVVRCEDCKYHSYWCERFETRTPLDAYCWCGERREDPILVVRCKDCKYLEEDECPWTGVIDWNGYCSKGERREDAETD